MLDRYGIESDDLDPVYYITCSFGAKQASLGSMRRGAAHLFTRAQSIDRV